MNRREKLIQRRPRIISRTIKVKEYQKRAIHLAKDSYQAAHVTNQVLLEAQVEYRDYTSSFLSEF